MVDMYRDYFTREQLVASVAKAPFVPGRLGELGLFTVIGLTATTMALEEEGTDAPALATPIPRGAPPKPLDLDKRKVHTFVTQTYAWNDYVRADEVLNMRAAGPTGAAEVITSRRDKVTAKLRATADQQHEYLRMQTLLSPNNAFGNKPNEAQIALATDATKTRQEVFNKIIKPMETALDGLFFSGLRVLCSDGYWSALIENKAIKETYLNTQAAGELRNDPRDAFVFGGVAWERYRGNSSIAVTTDKAIVVPEGVGNLFYMGFAPDDTIDSVGAGALGTPYYLRSEPLKGGKGWEITLQSHPVVTCTRPGAILTLGL